MPKHTRRCTVTRTITYTATLDTPGRPEETDPNMLTILGGAAGATGPLSISELLAGSISNTAAGQGISKGSWSITGTSINVEPYITRPANTVLAVGQRVASINPPAGYEAARGKLFVVSIGGTTDVSATEPNWTLTDGNTTPDGTVTYRTISKFPTLNTFAINGVYTLGQIVRPAGTSLKEYLVIQAGTAAGTAPTWTSYDTVGQQVPSNTVNFLCIAGVSTYAFSTVFALGELVKPSAASTQEYLCTQAGQSDQTALSASVAASVTRGTAIFKRII